MSRRGYVTRDTVEENIKASTNAADAVAAGILAEKWLIAMRALPPIEEFKSSPKSRSKK
jgi:hypothetical protein